MSILWTLTFSSPSRSTTNAFLHISEWPRWPLRRSSAWPSSNIRPVRWRKSLTKGASAWRYYNHCMPQQLGNTRGHPMTFPRCSTIWRRITMENIPLQRPASCQHLRRSSLFRWSEQLKTNRIIRRSGRQVFPQINYVLKPFFGSTPFMVLGRVQASYGGAYAF